LTGNSELFCNPCLGQWCASVRFIKSENYFCSMYQSDTVFSGLRILFEIAPYRRTEFDFDVLPSQYDFTSSYKMTS
jgi:hypothetical protein